MRFQLASVVVALLTATVLAQDAGVSSIVSQFDSIKSEIYVLTTATGNDVLAQATSLGSVLGSLIASISTNSDWPAASSILIAQASSESASLASALTAGSSIDSSITSAASSAESSASMAASSDMSSQSAAAASATSAGLAPMVTAGISGMMALGVLGAAVLL